MNDEKYLYMADVADKKRTARGIHNKRTHSGKAGCKLPHEYLTKRERDAMNGAVNHYNLSEPMTIKQLRKLPIDLQREYLEKIINNNCCIRKDIAEMLQVSITTLYRLQLDLGLTFPIDNKKQARSKEFAEKRAEFRKWAGIEPIDDAKAEIEVVPQPVVCSQTEAQQYISHKPEVPERCMSKAGNMKFDGEVSAVADEIIRILGGRQLRMTIFWEEIS